MSECRHGRSLNQDCYACAETADPREAPGPTEGLSEPKASEEAKLKTVLDREAVTIKRYEDKLDEAEAKLEAAEKSADWWRTRVARLASMEAFGLSRMIDQKADAELLLRIKYAECALTEGLTLTTKETTDETAVRA